jgi:hypothetical protein
LPAAKAQTLPMIEEALGRLPWIPQKYFAQLSSGRTAPADNVKNQAPKIMRRNEKSRVKLDDDLPMVKLISPNFFWNSGSIAH